MQPLKRNLNLRIYRRNRQAIVLLWDKLDGGDKFDVQQSGLAIRCDDASTSERTELAKENLMIGVKPSDIPKGMLQEFTPNDNTVICVIGHEKNRLDPDATYYLRVTCFNETSGIKVMPAGVYPSSEKEDKRKNVHIMAWDSEHNDWRKVEGARDKKGRFCLLVKLVTDDE